MSTKMAGFDCEFVEPPPKIFIPECPICLHILREPYQAGCCGKNFCKTCLEGVKEAKKPCPCCKSRFFTDFEDKRMQQTLYDFQVHCTYKSKGCEWSGELRELDGHLNENPSAGEVLKGCPFVVISCPMSYAGCDVSLSRQKMPVHLSEKCTLHVLMQAEQQIDLLNMVTVLENENGELREELSDKDEQIIDLELEISQLKTRLSSLEKKVDGLSERQKVACTTGLPIGPVEFTLYNFDKRKKDGSSWWSPEFYSHPQGYKMALRVHPDGWAEGKGTHISLAVYLKAGEFDAVLEWPFSVRISIQLLSQESDDHHTKVIRFIGVSKEKAKKGIGEAKFVPHSDLRSKHYLRNDCLKFQISRIVLL